jgi:type II secretory pathway component PulF
MPQFKYKAVTASGRTKTGTLEAADRHLAIGQLRGKTRQILSLTEEKPEKKAANSNRKNFGKVAKKAEGSATSTGKHALKVKGRFTSRELVGLNFLKRLLELHSSGMPLGDSVRLLSQRISDPQMKGICSQLWKELSEGRTLAASLATMPAVFGPSVTYVIEAGEQTGELVPILEKIVIYMEERREIKAKVLGSLVYPIFIICVAIAVIIMVLTFLMPQIDNMLSQLGGKRNLAAHLLIESGELMKVGGPFILGALLIFGFGFMQWRRTEKGRKVTDGILLRMPLVGPITLYSNLFQTSNLLATLLASGLTTTEALRLTERTIENRDLRERFNATRTQVNEGVAVSVAFRHNRFMPDLSLDILSVGENTGNLVHSLTEITKSFRAQLSQRMSRMTVLVSSGSLTVAFAIVAVVAYVMVSSIFQVSKSIG